MLESAERREIVDYLSSVIGCKIYFQTSKKVVHDEGKI